ncbi:ferritin [Murdochiella massiliensis]|uniref:ferritin n=1 Tax=Murdochiella massiliensis TaxID=1673723 RepID=UPI00082AA16D|nr:ferritin [Murdochiella massiliensis]
MKILDALNEQANFELESAYIYRTMSAYLAEEDMAGMKHFMDMQAKEEVEHADKMIGFLQEVGYPVHYRPLDPGEGKFKSLLDVFQKALAHEQVVTKNIYKLIDLAQKEDHKPAEIFLHWYVKEQVEEEATFQSLVKQLDRAGTNWGALYQIDHYLSQR